MKKILLSVVLVLGSLSLVSAQDNAIGLKLGYDGVDVSYQRMFSESNRLEANLSLDGFNTESLFVNAAYHWVFDLSQLAPGFNWYVGPGAGLGLYDGGFGLRVIGQIGIEYNFNIPLQLAIDWTPSLYVVPAVDFGWDGFKLAVRYKF